MDPQHLKVEEWDISLTRNYCITIKIQIISSIHIFILKIQQILGSCELKGHYHFWQSPPKNHWINFWLSWICSSMLETANFRVLWPDWPYPFLTTPTQQIFDQLLIFVNLYQHAKNQFIPYLHSSDTVNFTVPLHDWPHLFLTCQPLKFSITFSFTWNCTSMQKIS